MTSEDTSTQALACYQRDQELCTTLAGVFINMEVMKIILLMRSKVFTGRELRTCVVAAQHKIFDGKLCKVRIKSAIEKLHQSHFCLNYISEPRSLSQ